MKRTLFAIALAALASFPALAQDAKTPTLTLHTTDNTSKSPTARIWGLPKVPGNIVFYGGDSNSNSEGYANENTLLIGDTSVYAAVTAPKSGKVTVTAVFFATTSTVGDVFDPPTGTYDVRIGVSNGNCGTDLASGSGPQTAVPTGRTLDGIPEYFTTVAFAKPLTAQDGVTYWFNETPQCTNSGESACDSAEYYFDTTPNEANGVNANAQPAGQLYENSSFFGYTCTQLCSTSDQACRGSWGLQN